MFMGLIFLTCQDCQKWIFFLELCLPEQDMSQAMLDQCLCRSKAFGFMSLEGIASLPIASETSIPKLSCN
jgi:hypothetical protein